MNILQHTGNALVTIKSNPMRSALTMLGIIIGVASVVVMVALGQGAQAGVSSSINQLGTNQLTITAGSRQSGNVRTTSGAVLLAKDVQSIEDHFGSRVSVLPERTGSKQLIVGTNNMSAQVKGEVPAYATARALTLSAGRFLSASDESAAARVMVLGNTVASTLFTSGSPVGQSIRVENSTFTVIGVLDANSSTDSAVFIPLTTAMVRTLGGTSYSGITAVFTEDTDMTTAQAELTAVLVASRKTSADSPNFTVTNRSEFLSTLSSITKIFTYLLGGIAGISLFVGGIGVMNIMLVSVTERTREIGIRKAVGARTMDILMQFLVESIVLSAIGGLIGIGISVGIITLIQKVFSFSAVVSVPAMLIAFAFSAATGIIFGYLPARRAANLNIIDALRYE